MGKTDGKIFCLILFLISGLFLPLFSNDGSGTAASLTNFALPEYQKESGRLQFIIYGEKATNLGAMVELIKPKIDIVRNDVKNINDVVSLAHILPYPLYSKVPQSTVVSIISFYIPYIRSSMDNSVQWLSNSELLP